MPATLFCARMVRKTFFTLLSSCLLHGKPIAAGAAPWRTGLRKGGLEHNRRKLSFKVHLSAAIIFKHVVFIWTPKQREVWHLRGSEENADVIGRFCQERWKWHLCSYYQTKSRLCFDSRCDSLLFHKAIENSISAPRNGKSMYARRLTSAAGNKQETSSFQKPFSFCITTLTLAHSQSRQTVNTEANREMCHFL